MLLKSGINLKDELLDFINKSQSISIFSAYIKFESLKLLIDNHENVKEVFVRWESKDLLQGSSDLEVYPYLKSKGIALYRNPRLHLKAYLNNINKCLLTSSNISSRALNLPERDNYNYELGAIIPGIDLSDNLYFNVIRAESLLITDSIFQQICDQISEYRSDLLIDTDIDFEIKIEAPNKDFLISSLPLTRSVGQFCEFYFNELAPSIEELNCFLHDLALYKIPLGLKRDELLARLKFSFFGHKFIKSFLEHLLENNEIYFGRAKQWIHENCVDVPLPRRWELTENIQILYKWFSALGDGSYVVDIPGERSERLRYISN
jgi:hypothetical protein